MTGVVCMTICFSPVHICDGSHEANMHKLFMVISISPCREPKLFHAVIMKKINGDKNAQGQSGDEILRQDGVTRSEESSD